MAARVSGRWSHVPIDVIGYVSAAYFAYVGAFIYYFHKQYSANPGDQRYCINPHFITAPICNDWQSVGSSTRVYFTVGFLVAFLVLALVSRVFKWIYLAIPLVTLQFITSDLSVWLVSLGVALAIPAYRATLRALSHPRASRRLRFAPVALLVSLTFVASVLSALNAGAPVTPLHDENSLTTWSNVQISSISCTSSMDCQAAGAESGTDSDAVFSLHDGHWSSRGLASSGFDATPVIACSGPGECVLTGSISLFIEHKGSWSRNELNRYPTQYESLGTPVSTCAPHGTCWTVMYSYKGEVLFRVNQGRLLLTRVPSITLLGHVASVDIEAISCWSTRSCAAYGTACIDGNTQRCTSFVQSETSNVWRAPKFIVPYGTNLTTPVWFIPFTPAPFTCFSRNDCWLGGTTNQGGGNSISVVLHSEGDVWLTYFVGNSQYKQGHSTVESLACGSTQLCVVSGGTVTSGSASQYFQADVGGVWQRPLLEPFKSDGLQFYNLPWETHSTSATCPTPTSCYVVGYMNASNGPRIGFVATFADGKWGFEPLALGEGESSNNFAQTSCLQSTCWVVGTAEYPSGERGFIFRVGPS